MTSRCKKEGFSSPEFTKEEIMYLIEKGKCEVTGRKFNVAHISKYYRNPFSISPDRKDNSKGYTKKNITYKFTHLRRSS